MKLNLGCGRNKRPDYVNVDYDPGCEPDMVYNLYRAWPWPDNSADAVAMIHVLEHMGETIMTFEHVIRELYRVMKPGAELEVAVPHPRCDNFINDPTHVRPITPVLFQQMLSRRANEELIAKHAATTPLALQWGVNFELKDHEVILTPEWSKKRDREQLPDGAMAFALRTYWNVAEEIKMTVVRI